jgi:hypothetical protein
VCPETKACCNGIALHCCMLHRLQVMKMHVEGYELKSSKVRHSCCKSTGCVVWFILAEANQVFIKPDGACKLVEFFFGTTSS